MMKKKNHTIRTMSATLSCAALLLCAGTVPVPATLEAPVPAVSELAITASAASSDPGQDIVNYAKKFAGKTQKQMGYTDPWCARFVSDSAKAMGQSAAVPYNASCANLYKAILNAGGTVVQAANVKPGDIVFYYKGSGKPYPHVAIVVGKSAKGVSVIHGNYWYDPNKPGTSYSHVQIMDTPVYSDGQGSSTSNGKIVPIYVRPAYKTDNKNKTDNTNNKTDNKTNTNNKTVTVTDGMKIMFTPVCAPFTAFGAVQSKNFGNVQLLAGNDCAAVWTAHKYGSYFYFTNKNGYYLDCYGAKPKNKANVQVYRTSKVNDTQLFSLKYKNGYVYLVPKGTSLAVDCFGVAGTQKKNTNIWLFQLDYNKTQAFIAVKAK